MQNTAVTNVLRSDVQKALSSFAGNYEMVDKATALNVLTPLADKLGVDCSKPHLRTEEESEYPSKLPKIQEVHFKLCTSHCYVHKFPHAMYNLHDFVKSGKKFAGDNFTVEELFLLKFLVYRILNGFNTHWEGR